MARKRVEIPIFEEEGCDCSWDPFLEVFRLRLHWWVSFEISLREHQLKMLRHVISQALAYKKKAPKL